MSESKNSQYSLLLLIVYFITLSSCNKTSSYSIKNPYFSANTISEVRLTELEVNNTSTSLTFKIYPKTDTNFIIPTQTHLLEYKTCIKHKIINSLGIEINKIISLKAGEEFQYTLIFDALSKTCKSFDYIEENGKWFIKNISTLSNISTTFAQNLLGCWYNDSIKSTLLLSDSFCIYNNLKWDYNRFNKMNLININTKNKKQQAEIHYGSDSNIHLVINNDTLVFSRIFKRKNSHAKEYTILDANLFNNDSITISGYIHGLKSLGKKFHIQITDNNIIEKRNSRYAIKVNNDGTFQTTIPLSYSHFISIKSPLFHDNFYAEPGKETFILFHQHNYGNLPIYGGELGAVNNHYNILNDSIKKLSFKHLHNDPQTTESNYHVTTFNKWMIIKEAITAFHNQNYYNNKALNLIELNTKLAYASEIIEYSIIKEETEYLKDQIIKIDTSFLTSNKFVACSNFSLFYNQIYSIIKAKKKGLFKSVSDHLIKSKSNLSINEIKLLRTICTLDSIYFLPKFTNYRKKYGQLRYSFIIKNKSFLSDGLSIKDWQSLSLKQLSNNMIKKGILLSNNDKKLLEASILFETDKDIKYYYKTTQIYNDDIYNFKKKYRLPLELEKFKIRASTVDSNIKRIFSIDNNIISDIKKTQTFFRLLKGTPKEKLAQQFIENNLEISNTFLKEYITKY